MTAQDQTIEILDVMMALVSVLMVVTALLAAVAVRIVGRPGRDTASADDPYFYPIGDAPAVDSQFLEFRRDQLEKICAAFSPTRKLEAPDFSSHVSKIEERLFEGALLRNESGSRADD